MDKGTVVPLAEEKLNEPSREFLRQFLVWKPEWRVHCTMGESPSGCDLRIDLPSPTGNPELNILVWYAQGPMDLSIGFDPWHCHGSAWFEISDRQWRELPIFETLQLIVAGEIVIYSDASNSRAAIDALYMPAPFELEDYLTSPGSSNAIQIQSWEGSRDRVISLADLKL